MTLGTGCSRLHLPTPSRLIRLLLAVAIATALLPVTRANAAPGVLAEQTDPRIVWGGIWSRMSAAGVSGGDHTLSNASGASARIAFVGTQLDLIGMMGPKCGIASVSLDGAAPVSVDCYAPASAFGQTLLSLSGLGAGLHTVTVTVTGTKRAEAADAFVALDSVVVSGSLVGWPIDQSDTHVVRRGAWSTLSAAGLYGGSQHLTNTAGHEVAVAFTGTQLDVVGTIGPKFGIASVSVDGGVPVDVDFYSAETRFQQIVFSSGTLPAGPHVVRIICTGRKNAAALDAFVSIDAVLPSGTLDQATMRYEEADPRIAGNGDLHEEWAASLSGGRYVWAGPGWGAVAVAFVGGRFDWVGVTGPQFGIASVRIDGGAPQYVDLYAPAVTTKQTVFSTGEIPYGQHTVMISWTGRRGGAATGPYVGFDALDIGGELVQATTPARPAEAMTFSYPWARYLVVDKSDFRIYLVEDGLCIKSYPIAVGALGMTTPNAYWRIDAKYYTDPTSVYGPRKMRMFRQSGSSYVFTAYGIHGTNNEASIGTRASHGCIRLYNKDVIELFDMVPLGTMVVTRD